MNKRKDTLEDVNQIIGPEGLLVKELTKAELSLIYKYLKTSGFPYTKKDLVKNMGHWEVEHLLLMANRIVNACNVVTINK